MTFSKKREHNAKGGTFFVGYDELGMAIPKRVAIERNLIGEPK